MTSADDYRLAELAVHPVVSSLARRRRVLVLGPAGGLLERELRATATWQRWSAWASRIAAPFSRSLWPAHQPSERERPLVAEPIPWLEQHGELFDAVLMSLPLPASAREGKYYTRYFFELVGSRLTPHGALVVQTVLRDRSMPATFAGLRASSLAAGLQVSSYETPSPLLGAVSFLVGSRGAAIQLAPGQLPGATLPGRSRAPSHRGARQRARQRGTEVRARSRTSTRWCCGTASKRGSAIRN